MKSLVLAAAFVVLPTYGHAAASPAPNGFAMVAILQTSPERVGNRYSYVAETDTKSTRAGVARQEDQHEAFTLEVLSIDRKGMVVRLSQTEASLSPAAEGEPRALFLRAWNGILVDFQTTPNGYPTQIVDAGRVKAQLKARFAELSAHSTAASPQIVSWLDNLSDADLIKMAGDKLAMLAAMQRRGVVMIGHEDLADEHHQDPDGTDVKVKATIDFSPAPDTPCSLLIRRATWTERPDASSTISSSLNTEATVAESDGWVTSLTEVSKTVVPAGEQIKTVKITRSSHSCSGR